jgi:hypothetical protein
VKYRRGVNYLGTINPLSDILLLNAKNYSEKISPKDSSQRRIGNMLANVSECYSLSVEKDQPAMNALQSCALVCFLWC